MQDRVRQAEETMQEERRKNKQRIEEVEREFFEKEKELTERLKRDMNQLIQE